MVILYGFTEQKSILQMALDLKQLNPEQREAIQQIEGPSMVIAGAGSGKTRVLTYKIAYLVDSGINPYEILALTFTNKAAGEIKERVINLTGSQADKIWMGTFHSIFARILRIEAEKIGYTREFSIYDNDDSVTVIKRIMNHDETSRDNSAPSSIYNTISNLKNKFVLPGEFASMAKFPVEKKISKIYTEYQKELLKSNAMDFDDLLLNPILLFNRYPDILKKYQNRFKFILVDEYQDTNIAQYIVLKDLSGKLRNITVVGDDAQSIYKWRGAEIQNIFSFQEDFPEHKMYRLEQNYRSSGKILALADDIIKKNKIQIKKNLWTLNTGGESISLVETLSDKDEAQLVARQIKDEVRTRKLKLSEVAVLYRTNAQSRTLEEALRNSGMRYIIVGGIRFYQRKEIKDILCHLKVIVNPSDESSLLRALYLREGIGKVSVDKLVKIANDNKTSLYNIISDEFYLERIRGSAKNSIIKLLEFISKYRSIKKAIDLVEYVKGVIDEMKILVNLRFENTPEAYERISNIEEFISAVAQYSDSEESPTLEGFLEKVALVSDTDDMDDKKNAVTLMTVHSAKGLEYPVIFITGLEENLFPVTSALNEEEDMEEERRLFYVAVTRAKVKLYITFSNRRYRYGQLTYQIKSRFVKEISGDILKENVIFEKFSINKAVNTGSYPNVKLFSGRTGNKTSKKNPPRIVYYDNSDDKFTDIKKGVEVFHNNFGRGRVLSTVGRGTDKKAEIYFDDFGVKMIILKYAKMRVSNS
ncbi:MAG: UvrD-helicase domain-containing protein [Ignavibacteria bacterium]|nr:UvrD-helicase domain-containing protein [Ignavibacteria bacterium]